jgi:hypothetical protein
MPNYTHSYNHGLVTSSKGCAIEFVKVTGLNVAPGAAATCTVDDGASNLVRSVIHASTGVFNVQLNQPFPPDLLGVIPAISNADGTTDLVHPAYDSATYDADLGTFTIRLMNDDDSGAPVLVAGGATDELSLILVFKRYTTL